MFDFLKTIALPEFETERLYLRQLQVADYEDLYEAYKDKGYLRYFGIPPLMNKESTKKLIKEWIKQMELYQFMRWALVHKLSQKVIGTVGLHSFINAYKKGAVGYDLNPKYQHQGYMQEAIQMIMRYFFEDLGYHRLEAIIVVNNKGSIGVAERAGFQREGLMRKWMYSSDQNTYFDAYMYAVLDSDYTGGTYDL